MSEPSVRSKPSANGAVRKRRFKGGGCLTLCVGLPLLAVFAVFMVYQYHNRPVRIEVPTPSPPTPNAYDDFVRAGQLARAMPHKGPYSLPGPPAETYTASNFAAADRDVQPALAVVRGALDKPCQARLSRSPFTPFPEFAAFRELAREMACAAVSEDLQGHPESAATIRLDMLEMAVMFPKGGSLIASLVGIACEAIAMRGLEPLLPKLTAAQLAVVAARLDRIASKRSGFAAVVREEGWS